MSAERFFEQNTPGPEFKNRFHAWRDTRDNFSWGIGQADVERVNSAPSIIFKKMAEEAGRGVRANLVGRNENNPTNDQLTHDADYFYNQSVLVFACVGLELERSIWSQRFDVRNVQEAMSKAVVVADVNFPFLDDESLVEDIDKEKWYKMIGAASHDKTLSGMFEDVDNLPDVAKKLLTSLPGVYDMVREQVLTEYRALAKEVCAPGISRELIPVK